MSDIFYNAKPDLDPGVNITSFDDLQAPWYRGIPKGTVSGVMRGVANLNDLMLTGTDLLVPMSDEERGQQQYLREHAIDSWTPRSSEVGRAGQILGGIGEIAAPLAVGGIPLAAGSATLASGKNLVDQGVDATTASGAAAIEGLATAAGLKIPILGGSLASRLASGAVGNAAFGAASRAAEGKLLESRGYSDLAQQFANTPEAVATDVITGLLFGGLHHVTSPAINPALKPSEIDAALTLRNNRNFTTDTAPGTPESPSAQAAHTDAMTAAVEQLARGDQVDVSEAVARHDGAQFVDNGRIAQNADLASAVAQEIEPRLKYEPAGDLSPEDTAIESRFGEQLNADLEGAVEAYNKLPDAEGGRVIAGDVARELSPDYLKDRTKSAAVQEPSSALIKELYKRKLAEPPAEGQDPVVIFSGGGTGAGKTTGLKSIGKVDPAISRAQIIYDSNMSSFKSSVSKIDQALAAGKQVRVLFTYRDPGEAMKLGVLKRAMDQVREHGTGRTVPLDVHVKTHIDSRDVTERLARHYADNPNVDVQFIDNSRGRGKAKVVSLDELPRSEYNRAYEDSARILEEARAAGAISDAVYRGVRGEVSRGVAQDRAGGGRESQSQRAARFESTEAVKPGTPFLALRLGSSGNLVNRNAANPEGLALFLARLDDHDLPQPVGVEKSSAITVYDVRTPEGFGKYELGSRAKEMKGGAVGREVKSGGVSYSFPAGAKFKAEPVLRIPLAELRAEIKARAGTDNFDDLGGIQGGKLIRDIVTERLNKQQAESARPSAGVSHLSLDEALAAKPGKTEQVTPEIAALAQLVDEQPDAEVDIGTPDNPRKMSAADALDAIRAEYEKDIKDTKAYDAAVGCFIGHG